MYKNIDLEYQDIFSNKVAENQIMGYSYPKTKEEYWQTVDTYWADLLNIILMFCPEVINNINNKYFGEKTAVVVTKLKENRDIELVDCFNSVWTLAPDDGRIHLIKAWHILCDLCSESYLAYE